MKMKESNGSPEAKRRKPQNTWAGSSRFVIFLNPNTFYLDLALIWTYLNCNMAYRGVVAGTVIKAARDQVWV